MKKIHNSKNILVVAILLISNSLTTSAQSVQDINGKVYKTNALSELNGSPYLYDNFVSGIVTFKSGKKIDKLLLKYDQTLDLLLYQDSKGIILELVDPVKRFTLNVKDNISDFQNGFEPVDGNNSLTYYQILVDGNTKLLKRQQKYIAEEQGYTGSKERSIKEKTNYFVVTGDNAPRPFKNEKSLLKILDRPALSEYIKLNRLDIRKENDLIKLISYWDSLSGVQ